MHACMDKWTPRADEDGNPLLSSRLRNPENQLTRAQDFGYDTRPLNQTWGSPPLEEVGALDCPCRHSQEYRAHTGGAR